MFLSKLTKSGRKHRTKAAPPRRAMLRMESLEGRDLMSTVTLASPIAAPKADTQGGALAPYALTAHAVSPTEIDLSWSSDAQIGSAAGRWGVCALMNGSG